MISRSQWPLCLSAMFLFCSSTLWWWRNSRWIFPISGTILGRFCTSLRKHSHRHWICGKTMGNYYKVNEQLRLWINCLPLHHRSRDPDTTKNQRDHITTLLTEVRLLLQLSKRKTCTITPPLYQGGISLLQGQGHLSRVKDTSIRILDWLWGHI